MSNKLDRAAEGVRLQQVAELVLNILNPDVAIRRAHDSDKYIMDINFAGFYTRIDVTEFIERVKATGEIRPQSTDKAMFDKAIKELARVIVEAK